MSGASLLKSFREGFLLHMTLFFIILALGMARCSCIYKSSDLYSYWCILGPTVTLDLSAWIWDLLNRAVSDALVPIATPVVNLPVNDPLTLLARQFMLVLNMRSLRDFGLF